MAGLVIELFVAALEDGLARPQLAESGRSGFEYVAAELSVLRLAEWSERL